MKRYRIYTGPTIVRDVAHRLMLHGVTVDIEGTEHVYVSTERSKEALVDLLGVRGGWSLKDIQELHKQ